MESGDPFYYPAPVNRETMNAESQRDQALAILGSRLEMLSKSYKKCYLSSGRGGVIAYARNIIAGHVPNEHDYRTKKELLDIFDAPSARISLSGMIDNYNQRTEGVMTLITDYSNATYFVTVKFPRPVALGRK